MRVAAVLVLVFVGIVACNVQIPFGWKAAGIEPRQDEEIRVIFSLTQENLLELERLFWERSDPKNAMYAQYLSRNELSELLSPGRFHETAVTEWLLNNKFEEAQIETVETHDVLYVTGTVEHFENLFNVNLEVFNHRRHEDKKLYRSRDPVALPEDVGEHIQLIHGINDFPPLKRHNKQRNQHKRHHKREFEVEAVANPTVSILSVNGRSQSAGSDISMKVSYQCPSNSVANCIDTIKLIGSSSNNNIVSNAVAYIPTSDCTGGVCSGLLDVEFYVPMNISAVGLASDGSAVSDEVYWGYPVVVDPHVVPQTLWELYSMTRNPIVTNTSATQAVVEFEQQYYSPSDLEEFFTLMGIPSAPVYVEGPNDINNPGGEANLDIQWIMAMAPGAPTFFWSVAASSAIEIDHILTWAYQIGNYTNPPLVNSLSYGMTEGNVDKYLGQGYLNRTNTQLQVLALQGLTIIIADGDTGSNDIGPPPMSQLQCFPSHPDWPSDSAYVTAIGSTFITPLAEPICYVEGGSDCLADPVGEVTVSVDMGMSWTTGGGFSNVTPRPSYQDAAVNAYLTNSSSVVPPLEYFNSRGRAYADAVTVGHNLEVVLSGEIVAIDGTSASAPIFGGMVTVLNDARLNAGKAPLGFITPLMYAAFQDVPSCWNDVTVGHNKCGAYGWKPVCCDVGFTAAVGWDPVSGVGSPNMAALKQYVLSLP